MSKYKKVFTKTLNEYNIPDMARNPRDVQVSDEVDAETFNVDPMDADVGFKSNNMERDIEELKSILSEVGQMTQKMKDISENIASLGRSFSDIGKTSKTVANINQKLHDLNGELEGYIISLPAQKDENEAEMAPEPQEQGAY